MMTSNRINITLNSNTFLKLFGCSLGQRAHHSTDQPNAHLLYAYRQGYQPLHNIYTWTRNWIDEAHVVLITPECTQHDNLQATICTIIRVIFHRLFGQQFVAHLMRMNCNLKQNMRSDGTFLKIFIFKLLRGNSMHWQIISNTQWTWLHE